MRRRAACTLAACLLLLACGVSCCSAGGQGDALSVQQAQGSGTVTTDGAGQPGASVPEPELPEMEIPLGDPGESVGDDASEGDNASADGVPVGDGASADGTASGSDSTPRRTGGTATGSPDDADRTPGDPAQQSEPDHGADPQPDPGSGGQGVEVNEDGDVLLPLVP